MPTWILDYESGQTRQAGDDEAASLVGAGKAGLQQGSVPVEAPDGTLGTIDATEAQEALGQGFRLRSEAELHDEAMQAKYGGAAGQVAATVAGAARGLTLGGSDLAARAIGGQPAAEYLEGVREANPKLSVAGEAGGAIGGLLIPGVGEATGPGLVAKLGAGAERIAAGAGAGLARRTAARAAGGLAEGGVWGLGSAVTEASLGDGDLAAEKLVASAGIGALTGGVLSAGTGALSGVVKKVADTEGAASLREGLDEWANKKIIKAIAGPGHLKSLRTLEGKGITDDVAEYAYAHGLIGQPHAIAEKASEMVEHNGKRIGELLDFGDAASKPILDGSAIADKIESEVVAPLKSGNVGDQSVAKRIGAEADAIRERGFLGFREAEKLKQSFDKYLKFGAEQGPVQESLKQVRGIVAKSTEEGLDAVAGSLNPDLVGEFQAAKKGFRMASEVRDLAEERARQLHNNHSFGLLDHEVGGALGVGHAAGHAAAGPASLAVGLLGAVGSKTLREYGPQLLARGAKTLANSETIGHLLDGFGEAMRSRLATVPQAFGPFRGVLEQAAARGGSDLLATHISLAKSDPAYRDAMAEAGMGIEEPEDAEAHAGRLQKLSAVHGALADHDARLDAAVGRFLGVQGGAAPAGAEAPKSRKERLEDFQRASDALSGFMANPSSAALAASPGGTLTDAAPGVAAAASATALRAVQFLHGVMPTDPAASPIPALSSDWKPSDSDLDRFGRYVRAVNNPASVLADLKSGHVTGEAIQALQAVYPKLLNDIRQRTIDKVATLKDRLPHAKREALSVLMAGPVGGAGDPSVFAVAQTAHAQAMKAEAQKKQALDDKTQRQRPDSYATPSQRLEGRTE